MGISSGTVYHDYPLIDKWDLRVIINNYRNEALGLERQKDRWVLEEAVV
jgi:predicted mannosyl-3-phosphoglycerate phosphatase (HAD superfamily)